MDLNTIAKEMHYYLMKQGIPYKHVSVVYRNECILFTNKPTLMCIFSGVVRDKVTNEIKVEMEQRGFTYSFVK